MPTTADMPAAGFDTAAIWEEASAQFSEFSQAELVAMLAQALPKPAPTHAYYRHRKTGEIHAFPIDNHTQIRKTNEGWERLNQYGVFQETKHVSDNPYEVLFQRGGAGEMTVAQLIDNGFHYHPPLLPACGRNLTNQHPVHTDACYRGARTVTFPQLEGRTFPDKPVCEYGCDDRWFPTVKARDQHYAVMHGDVLAEQAQGKALAAGVKEALGTTQPRHIVDDAIEQEERERERERERAKAPVYKFEDFETTDLDEFMAYLAALAEPQATTGPDNPEEWDTKPNVPDEDDDPLHL